MADVMKVIEVCRVEIEFVLIANGNSYRSLCTDDHCSMMAVHTLFGHKLVTCLHIRSTSANPDFRFFSRQIRISGFYTDFG